MNDLDFSKLLGFDAVADQLSNGVDFQDQTVGAKLGSKVGFEPNSTGRVLDFQDPQSRPRTTTTPRATAMNKSACSVEISTLASSRSKT